ncbi:sterol desaturase family [Cordyceps militaris CM01]|uniref:Sterol desaturase family n=1 Tax=Cordyceps militaris (strain CM01) TaxID=983644 RepID=G3JT82_CORMM|nr:sterol desaturase family [Cordyceps militaris CM01]EGX88229.1 sterol desaturase family [Cordyceps militaris CM01]
MDVLLSIPVMSYFLAPAPSFSSIGVSLLLYLNWLTLILSHSALKVHLVGVLALRVVFWLLPSLLTLLFDASLPSLAESIKHGRRAGLPPRNRRVLAQLLLLAVFNTAFLVAVEGACSYALTVLTGTPEFVVATTLPLPWQMAKHMAVMMLAREALQYYIHRFLLHGRSSSVARLHKQYAHAQSGAPFSLQLMTDHPVPLLLHRFLPMYLPGVALRHTHLLTYFFFVALCTLEETFSMSGYTVAPGILLRGLAQRGAIHYASGGAANFGPYGVADWAHGTSRGRDVLEDLQDEAEKHHLPERAGKKVSDGAGMLQDGLEALRGNKSNKARKRA